MTYPNMDLQSLPDSIDLRVGTDAVERTLQLSFWQAFAALQGIGAIQAGSQYPETIVQAGEEAAFDTAIDNLVTAFTTVQTQFNAIWALVP